MFEESVGKISTEHTLFLGTLKLIETEGLVTHPLQRRVGIKQISTVLEKGFWKIFFWKGARWEKCGQSLKEGFKVF